MTGWPDRRRGGSDRQRLRRRLVALIPYLAVAAIAVVTVVGLAVRPETTGTAATAEQVIIVGAVGLRWDDLDPDRTPHLWGLAQTGAIGSLSPRSAHRPTCAADGWLTLGAGNWAAGTLGRDADRCGPLRPTIEAAEASGAYLPDQEQLVRHNQWDLPWGTVPGALAGAVECTVAVGQGAAVAAARAYGRVDRYRAELPEQPDVTARLLGERCELAVVDLGTVAGEGERRVAAVRQLDETFAQVQAARPEESLLMVAGVGAAETDQEQHLQVAIADAPGLPAGWLTSATTARTGYVQLADLAPTALAALDRPMPDVRLAGHPAYAEPGRPADLTAAVPELAAADREAVQAKPVSAWFLTALTLAQLLLFAAVIPRLRAPNRLHHDRPPARGWWRTGAEMLLVAAALAIPAGLVADWAPWWRATNPGGVFAVTSLAVLAAVCLLVLRTPIFRHTLALVAAAAGVAAAAVAVDLLTGSWLQLNGVVGYSAHDGGRYAGLSDVGLGVLVAGALLVAGCVAEQVPRARRPLVVAAVVAVGVVVAGSPYLGDNIGGAVALLVGGCVAAALCTGGWLTPGRLVWASLTGLAVVTAVAIVDLRRPLEQRSGLGAMLGQFAEGTAGLGLRRLSLANVEAFTSTPLTVLTIGGGAFIWFALLRPWGGLRRLFAIHPALRAGMVGAVVAALIGGVLVGTALAVAGAAAAVGVPLLTFASLRLREQSVRRAAPRAPAERAGGVSVEFRGSSADSVEAEHR